MKNAASLDRGGEKEKRRDYYFSCTWKQGKNAFTPEIYIPTYLYIRTVQNFSYWNVGNLN